jgi:transcriptional regulator with AbiEi antitoxin domain of type IV toxin-antitoxin system
MNTPQSTEADLQDRFRQILPPEWSTNFFHGKESIELEIPAAKVVLRLFVRMDPRPRDFPFGVEGVGNSSQLVPVLAAPRVSPRLQERLREEGWGWLDGAGNAYLSIPGHIHLERSGHAPLRRSKKSIDLGSPLALQVIRALLHPDHAFHQWALRDLREACAEWDQGSKKIKQPSLGLMSKLVGQLVDNAYLKRDTAKGPVRLIAPEALLKDTGKEYRAMRRLECFSLLSKAALETGLQEVEMDSGGYAAWAAFSAGDLLAPAVNHNKNWMMVAPRFLELLLQKLQAKEVDSGANLVLLVPEDDAPFYLGERINMHLLCTSAVQTYWDLLHAGGRGVEAAQAVLDQCLRPAWAAVGKP